MQSFGETKMEFSKDLKRLLLNLFLRLGSFLKGQAQFSLIAEHFSWRILLLDLPIN